MLHQIQRCELTLGKCKASRQLFHAFYFLVRHVHVDPREHSHAPARIALTTGSRNVYNGLQMKLDEDGSRSIRQLDGVDWSLAFDALFLCSV